MQLATWGTFKFKADAQKCADEIMEICEELESATPQQILENLKVMEGTGFSEEELKMIDEIVGV